MKQDKIVTGFFGFLNSNFVNVTDWILAFVFTGFGLYGCFYLSETSNWHIASLFFGIVGFITAYKKPSKLIEGAIKKKVVKK